MSNFANAVRESARMTTTANGAKCYNTTGSKMLDLFSTAGGMRTRINDVRDAFSTAWNENPELAIKLAFYCRDIRGGMGERDVAREMLRWVAEYHPATMRKNLKFLPEYGRWDDIYVFVGTKVENDVWQMVREQFIEDTQNVKAGKSCSLMAKWLKSVNTSSKKSVELGRLTARKLGLSYMQYQKTLAKLRKHINVTEVNMSANKWTDIDYGAVPSKAMTNYRSAFARHDHEGFTDYINAVKAGEKTIKANTLYPYDLVHQYMGGGGMVSYRSGYYNCGGLADKEDAVVEAQWKALPNYIDGNHNVMVMADTSGSMRGQPIESALGLAMYFAERNSGPYKNLFMTFSTNPCYVTLDEQSMLGNLKKAAKAEWMGSTNLEAAFVKILKTALDNHLTDDELPKALIIISDMQFNKSLVQGDNYFDSMKNMYAAHGYTLPHVVFWCVSAWAGSTHHYNYNDYVTAFSGNAASTFRDVLGTIGYNAYEAMLKVLNGERYAQIHV